MSTLVWLATGPDACPALRLPACVALASIVNKAPAGGWGGMGAQGQGAGATARLGAGAAAGAGAGVGAPTVEVLAAQVLDGSTGLLHTAKGSVR